MRQGTRAFSFVEIMIGVVMGLFVMVSMADIFQSSQKLFHKTEQVLEAFQSAVLASKVIEQDFNTMVLPEADDKGRFVADPPGVVLDEVKANEGLFRPFVWEKGSNRPPLRLAHPDGKDGPLRLSTATRPFVFYRVDGEGAGYRLQKVSYSLKHESAKGLGWVQLERSTEVEGESPEVRLYSMHLKDVILDLRWVPWDPKASKDDIEAGKVSYYMHLWVCGVSSNVDSRRMKDAEKKGRDYFPHVCMRTVALEVLNERLSSRRGGAYWRTLRAEGAYLTGEGILAK